MTPLQAELFAMQDVEYQQFQSKLLPTLAPEVVIGVRIPQLRRFARQFAARPEAADFLQALPHRYYEEYNLHGFLIERCGDFAQTIALLDAFLPYVDNWATCDLVNPRVLGRHKAELLPHIHRWMAADHPYTVRYGMGMLMRWYLDDAFDPVYLDWVEAVRSEEYYVNMMVAWFFATALAKQYDAALPYLAQHRLPDWTHNKAIQKAVESYRLSAEQKAVLRGFRQGRGKTAE